MRAEQVFIVSERVIENPRFLFFSGALGEKTELHAGGHREAEAEVSG